MKPSSAHLLEQEFRTHVEDYGLAHDPVTGLPNAASFRADLGHMLAQASEENGSVALLWIDLMNVRREYAIGGEAASNRLACTLADALLPAAEQGELVCRFGDRCFLMALKNGPGFEDRLDQILEIAGYRKLRGFEGKPEIASGVAFFPEHSRNQDELIRFACMASGNALRTRSRSAIVFRPAMSDALLHERLLEKDLRQALAENQLTVVYQPQIDLGTGNVLGAEVLMRWQHPVRGFVSPAQFIALAEQSELIDEIFLYSLRKLLADVAIWRAQGIVLPLVAINASPANIRHAEFVETVARELMRNPLGETQIEIEVTESLLMDDEELFLERIRDLRAIGVRVALDDFGTRYTGFNALKGLPLHAMKIDRCFVHGVHRASQAQSLFRTIVAMANHLELATVAEGIEDMGELVALKKVGCQSGQGYLFQRPVAAREFLYFLEDWPKRKASSEFATIFTDIAVDPAYEIDPLFGALA